MSVKENLHFLQAVIANEKAIDAHIMKNLYGRNNFSYTPLKALRTLKYIDKYRINQFMYGFISLCFIFLFPLFFFYQLIKSIIKKSVRKDNTKNRTVVLLANSRITQLIKKIQPEFEYSIININQSNFVENTTHIYSFISIKNFFSVYCKSVFYVFLLLFNFKEKTDILRAYVVFEVMLVKCGLSKLAPEVDTVYFANHYDRWAFLFDTIFYDKRLILIQHGLLSETFALPYPLKNISEIYAFNKNSEEIFESIFDLKNVKFRHIHLDLNLTDVSEKFSLLIIGQPHSASLEIEAVFFILKLVPDVQVYLKPHPIFGEEPYADISLPDEITIIMDNDFFPKVNIALHYESTLGMEYEHSGISVVSLKDHNAEEVAQIVASFFEAMRANENRTLVQ